MYIFSRQRSVNPASFRDAVGHAVGIAELVTDITGTEVFVWMSQFGPEGPAITWSSRVDSMSDLDTRSSQLMTSDAYAERIEEIDDSFTGAATDSLIEIVSGTLASTPTQYVAVTQALAAPGRIREAVAWGADLAEKASTTLDVPVAFGVGVYGPYGSMGWLAAHDDADSMDQSRAKMMADETLQTAIDDGGDLVQPHASQMLLRRLN